MLKKTNLYQVVTGDLIVSSVNILAKLFAANVKIIVTTPTVELAEKIDAKLWTFASNLFTPHGLSWEEKPEQQPILLTTINDLQKNINNATCLILIAENIEEYINTIKIPENIDTLMFVFTTEKQNEILEYFNQIVCEKKYFIDLSGKWQEYIN